MNLLLTVLLLLICLLISDIISHYIPFIPTALIQITLGIFIAFVFKDISIKIDTEWFLLLFVAPLLYNDGQHFSREKLWKMKEPIFGNAIILVLLTTIVGGYFIHWLIPDIPLVAAFALAAVLSPTDPVAVNGIAKRVHIPEKVLTLVRGESLINDASGLVAFNYAVAAVVTGYFSLKEAALDFSYMFIVGALLGLILGLLIDWIGFILRKKGISDATFHSLLQILTPFIIYITTEELFHASGVIAVVVAGIAHSSITEHTVTIMAREKVLSENVWSVLLFILNGVVFILLGLSIPSSMSETVASTNINNWLAIGYVLAIWLAIVIIRFIWSYFSMFYRYYIGKNRNAETPSLKTCLLISLTGVRGAVTMAAVLSIPYVLMSGEAFPERSLILFTATGVILVTLIIATIFLPLLCKKETGESKEKNKIDINEAIMKIFAETIRKIRQEINEDNELVAYELINEYKRMLKKIQFNQNSVEIDKYQQKLTEVKFMGLKAERNYIRDLMETNHMAQDVYEIFEASLDHREEVLSSNVRSSAKYILGKTLRIWNRYSSRHHKYPEKMLNKVETEKEIQIKAFQAAIESLEKCEKEYSRPDIVQSVILDYKSIIKRLSTATFQYNERSEDQKEELRIKIMDSERHEIQRMYEAGEISNEQAKELRRHINYMESATLEE